MLRLLVIASIAGCSFEPLAIEASVSGELTVGGRAVVLADGDDHVHARVDVRDRDGSPVAGIAVLFTLEPSGGAVAQPARVYTDDRGRADTRITSTTAGTFVLGARIDSEPLAADAPQRPTLRFVNDASGTVGTPLRYSFPILPEPEALAAGDLDDNGAEELVIAAAGATELQIAAYDDDTGATTVLRQLTATARGVAVVDLDRDGHLDVAATLPASSSLNIFFGAPPGGSPRAQSVYLGAAAGPLAAGDLGDDDTTDFVAVAPSSRHATLVTSDNGGADFLLTLRQTGMLPLAVVIADLHPEPGNEIALALYGEGRIVILDAYGDVAASVTSEVKPVALAAADFDGDDRDDLVIGGEALRLHNPHSGVTSLIADQRTRAIAAGDLNDDERVDLATVAADGEQRLRLYFGRGDGSFDGPLALAAGATPSAVVVLDFDGDGRADVAVADRATATAMVFFGRAP